MCRLPLAIPLSPMLFHPPGGHSDALCLGEGQDDRLQPVWHLALQLLSPLLSDMQQAPSSLAGPAACQQVPKARVIACDEGGLLPTSSCISTEGSRGPWELPGYNYMAGPVLLFMKEENSPRLAQIQVIFAYSLLFSALPLTYSI